MALCCTPSGNTSGDRTQPYQNFRLASELIFFTKGKFKNKALLWMHTALSLPIYYMLSLPGTITYSKKSLAASQWRLLWQRSTTHQHKSIKFSLDPPALFFIFLVSCLLHCLLYSHLLLPGNASLLSSHCKYLTSPLSWQSVCCPFQTTFIGNDHWRLWSVTSNPNCWAGLKGRWV